jgi:hypothetical protein
VIGRLNALVQRVALTAPLLLASGCYTDDSLDYDPMYCQAGIEEASIDAGGILILDPGRVGATAEYLGDGAWRFATACDTAITNVRCNWQLTVTPLDGAITNIAPETLENDDFLEPGGATDESVVFDAITDVDIDGFTLDATPGATLRVDVALDGACGGPFFFWLDRDEPLAGITPSIELTPSEP